MEYETQPVDQDCFAELDRRYDADYEQAKRGREEAKACQERALRAEYEAQGHGPSHSQRVLEKALKQQEKEREERAKAVREGRERQKLEAELADLQSGFHYYDH
jgi:hypothetical protein